MNQEFYLLLLKLTTLAESQCAFLLSAFCTSSAFSAITRNEHSLTACVTGQSERQQPMNRGEKIYTVTTQRMTSPLSQAVPWIVHSGSCYLIFFFKLVLQALV